MRKHNDFSGVGGSDIKIYGQNEANAGAFDMRKHKDFSAVGGGLRRGVY